MNTFYATLTENITRTVTVDSFRFSLEEKIDFLPGQFVKVIFDEKDFKNKEMNKYLSLSSSPTKDYIEVTKKLSSSRFSDNLRKLKKGDKVLLQGPMGNCIFKEEYKKIGFLIGGIGITPVISIIEYIIDRNLTTDVVLLYSNRHHTEIAFRKELDNWKFKDKNLQVIYTLTDCLHDEKVCIKGQINKGLMTQHVPDIDTRRFFIYGPPVMVEAMKNMCTDCGCDENRIMIENFTGY
jgi:ferredoxin-NADP reductase